MPDYCACRGENCPKKNQCARYLMAWSTRQSVFASSPFKVDKCEHFWDIEHGAPFELREENIDVTNKED